MTIFIDNDGTAEVVVTTHFDKRRKIRNVYINTNHADGFFSLIG